MSDAICEVCGRERYSPDGVRKAIKELGVDGVHVLCRGSDMSNRKEMFACYRIGYKRQKARAEAAEKEVSDWQVKRDVVLAENTTLRAEVDALKGEIASAYQAAGWEPQYGALADRMSGVIAAFRDSAELDAIRAEAAGVRPSAEEFVASMLSDDGGDNERIVMVKHRDLVAAMRELTLREALRETLQTIRKVLTVVQYRGQLELPHYSIALAVTKPLGDANDKGLAALVAAGEKQ